MSLHWIIGYWYTTAFSMTWCFRQVTSKVHERQLRLYDHVERLALDDPAHRIALAWIRAGPYRRAARVLRGCIRCRPIWRIRAWRSWSLPGRWPDGGWRSTVARRMWRHAAPHMFSYLTYVSTSFFHVAKFNQLGVTLMRTFDRLQCDCSFDHHTISEIPRYI